MRLPGFSKETDNPVINLPSQLALRITTSCVQAAIWVKKPGEGVNVLALSNIVDYKEDDIESLVLQADSVLGECIEQLPEQVDEPHQVLYGLPSTWSVNGSLTEQARQYLKQLSAKLDLQALGTVGNIEAIVNFISVHHGVVNGILVGVDDEQLEVGLAIQGMVNSVATFRRSSDFVHDVKGSIGDFKHNHLPPKIILWGNDQDLTGLHQQLMSYPWQEAAVGFLHLPDIAMLPANLPLEAIIFATEPRTDHPRDSDVQAMPVAAGVGGKSPKLEDDIPVEESDSDDNSDEVKTESEEEESVLQAENGNGEDESVWEDGKEPVSDPEILHEHAKTLTSLGFVRDQDIREVTENAFDNYELNTDPHVTDSGTSDVIEPPQTVVETGPAIIKSDNLPAETAPVVRKRKLKSLRWIVIGIVSSLLIGGLVGGLYAIWKSSSAMVTMKVKSTDINESFTVTLDTDKSVSDMENGVLAGKLQTSEAAGSSTVNSTGKATVGEKAQGEVTIFNDTDVERTLAAGTKLTTTDAKKLVFTLDTTVKIASKSVDLSNQTTPFSPGVATAKVTAEKLGAESNIGASTAFGVANFSSSILLARNDKAFSGGSSKEVKVVSKLDQQAATDQLKKQLSTEALDKLMTDKDNSIELVDTSSSVKWKEQTFNKEINSESDSVTASGTLTYTIIGYDVNEIKSVAKEKLVNAYVNEKDSIGDISVDFELDSEKSKDNIFVFNGIAKAKVKTKVSIEKIAQKIAGQNTKDMQTYMMSLPNVSDVVVVRRPALPLWFDKYPPNAQKINIVVEYE